MPHALPRRALAAAAAAVTLVVAAPALAVGSFGSAHKVTPSGCWDADVVAGAGGAVHGFVNCRTNTGRVDLFYVSAGSTTAPWSLHRVARGGKLLATADDGRRSYALYTNTGAGTHVLIRSHNGGVRDRRLTGHSAFTGDIEARDGHYWSVYDLNTAQGSGCSYLYESKTIGKDVRNKELNICGTEPRLDLGRTSHMTLVWREGLLDVGGRIYLRKANDTSWAGRQKKLSGKASGRLPYVQISGRTTRVTWLKSVGSGQFDVVFMSQTGHHHWQSKRFSRLVGWEGAPYPQPRGAEIAPYGKRSFFLAWTAIAGASRGVVNVVEKTRSGWSSRDVSDGSSYDNVLADLDTTSTGAYVVMTHVNGNSSYTVMRGQ